MWYRRFAAMNIKTALRDFPLCHQCCMTKSWSPLPQEGGWRRYAMEDRGVRSFQIFLRTYPQPYRAAPFRSGKQKESPFMGRLRANFARLGNPMQDCHLRKEPALRDCLPAFTCHPERQRRSSALDDYETNAIKYQSAGRSHLRWLSPFGALRHHLSP